MRAIVALQRWRKRLTLCLRSVNPRSPLSTPSFVTSMSSLNNSVAWPVIGKIVSLQRVVQCTIGQNHTSNISGIANGIGFDATRVSSSTPGSGHFSERHRRTWHCNDNCHFICNPSGENGPCLVGVLWSFWKLEGCCSVKTMVSTTWPCCGLLHGNVFRAVCTNGTTERCLFLSWSGENLSPVGLVELELEYFSVQLMNRHGHRMRILSIRFSEITFTWLWWRVVQCGDFCTVRVA